MFDLEIKKFLQKNNYPQLEIRAVFFDMDGVLYDSMPAHSAAWVLAMAQFGFRFTTNDCYMNEGRTGEDTINEQMKLQYGRQATPDEMSRIYKLKTKYFEDAGGAPQPMPFANELLQKIKRQKRRIALVTGSGQASLLSNLQADFPDIFSTHNTVTAFDVTRGKPDPEPYLLALSKAGVKQHQAMVVENAPLGVQAAKAAGLFTIAVNTGTLQDKVLADFGADIVLSSIEELYNKWDQIVTVK
ncbi:MAG: HAD-IA family hydrolase [Prevotellaceae bacterium]|jgi:HAD superfamily hydrolase (TIGR01509 family)|nr:HAD-IA family hydrolase [Prevotellaceae bacterium]